MFPKVSLVLTLLVFFSTACALGSPFRSGVKPAVVSETSEILSSGSVVAPTPTPAAQEPIVLPISVYVLDDEDGRLSSTRTAAQLKAVYHKVNEIWAQAGIKVEVQTIDRVPVPPLYLEAIAARDFRPFFSATRERLDIPNPSLLNGFYAKDIGGPNGITPFGSRVFFVTDVPSVHDERVSSHEIGHILGLHHTLEDTSRLMYPGTNGMLLTEAEITVARYAAQGLLDGVR